MFPDRCPVCDEILFEKNKIERPRICKECSKKLTYIKQPVCFKCGKQLDDDSKEYCYDCMRKNFSYTRGVAAFSYSDAMKTSMYAFKYNNRREYAGFYANVIAEEFGSIILSWKPDVLVPVPMYKAKMRKRGYNQAEVLANRLSEKLGIPMDAKILERTRDTVPQKELKEEERKNNIKNAFQIRKNGLEYSKIVLVDDIYTTGTTIDECARVFLQAGVSRVYFITACIGKGF